MCRVLMYVSLDKTTRNSEYKVFDSMANTMIHNYPLGMLKVSSSEAHKPTFFELQTAKLVE